MTEHEQATDGIASSIVDTGQNENASLPSDRVVMKRQIALSLSASSGGMEIYDPRPAEDDRQLAASSRPFFSVVIPNYNGFEFLPMVMAALDAQIFRDFETIVVDDASTDASVQWLEQNAPNTRIIVNRRNEGFAKSCNTAASASRGKFIVLLNSDTEPDASWLSELAQAVCASPDTGIFASKVLLYDKPDTLHTTGDLVGANGLPINRGVWELDLGQYDESIDVFGGSGCAVAYRRELWEALGGFDESFWMYLEDADFAFRAQLIGANARFVPSARVLHKLTATAGGILSSYYVGRNTIWLIAKNMPASILISNFDRIVGVQLSIALDALRNIRGAEARARLKGQVVGLITITRMLAKRKSIQSRRIADNTQINKRLYG